MPLNLQGVRQYLSELRNSGGLHKDQAEKYRNILLEILKNPESEMAESLKAFVEATLLYLGNYYLMSVHICHSYQMMYRKKYHTLRLMLSNQGNQNWKEAANVLVGIPLETGQNTPVPRGG
ncbi:unnamed protein product [Leptidea sinapis]|uniref:Uncharacterized protein n=1 Tax=Leptidea sinapis TaxID=189913 RepID=A0A5E4PN63_9NEOP|nr:unnamed protein product [Leptidea sinapis]